MESITITELLTIGLLMGAVSMVLGAAFQLIIARRQDKRFKWRHLVLIIVTRVLAILLGLFSWAYWALPFDVFVGPIMLPVLFAEIVLSPLMLFLFGYHMGRSRSMLTRNNPDSISPAS